MIALLLAAQLAASPAANQGLGQTAEPMRNLYSVPPHCAEAPYKVVDRYGRPVLRKLNTLPKGALQFAVNRTVNGCAVLTVISGEAMTDNPTPAPGDYQVTPSGAPGRRR